MSLFESMEGAGVERDTVTYSTVISACAKGRLWEEAVSLFELMEGACVERDTITYGIVISAC